ncbi:MAG: class I SAM-dependent methyltransferase [Patescibacteria group bacterium]|nr:class I SAM-dependent methyltransferase [Patescibacteria group bacterium]MCL5262198.1 class I SAM-dependent methyltransferase [Patescibacteria group bacterium]
MNGHPHRIGLNKKSLGGLKDLLSKFIAHHEDFDLFYDYSSESEMVTYKDVIPIIQNISDQKHFYNISISGCPLCVFPREGRAWTGFVSLVKHSPGDTLVEKCSNCLLRELCPGVPKAYTAKFGDVELRPFMANELFIRDLDDVECVKAFWDQSIHHQQFLWDLFFKDLSGKILDVGAGLGEFVSLDPKRIIGVDYELDKIKNAMAKSLGLDLRYGDARHLNFPNNKFGGILCYFVLEHMDYQGAKLALKEMWRVLKPGGKLLIVTQGKDGCDRFLGDPETVKYTRQSLTSLARPCHFHRAKIIDGAYLKPYAGFNFNPPRIKLADKQTTIGLMAEK